MSSDLLDVVLVFHQNCDLFLPPAATARDVEDLIRSDVMQLDDVSFPTSLVDLLVNDRLFRLDDDVVAEVAVK